VRNLARKGNLTVKLFFDLEEEDALFTAIMAKVEELRTANVIESWIMDAEELPFKRHAEG